MFSSAFRGSPEPQMTELRDDVVLLEHSDPGARQAQLSPRTHTQCCAPDALSSSTRISRH